MQSHQTSPNQAKPNFLMLDSRNWIGLKSWINVLFHKEFLIEFFFWKSTYTISMLTEAAIYWNIWGLIKCYCKPYKLFKIICEIEGNYAGNRRKIGGNYTGLKVEYIPYFPRNFWLEKRFWKVSLCTFWGQNLLVFQNL